MEVVREDVLGIALLLQVRAFLDDLVVLVLIASLSFVFLDLVLLVY
jgi:hypothetical protein